MALSNATNIESISGNGNQDYDFTIPFFASSDIKCFVQLTSTSTPVELQRVSDDTSFGSLTTGTDGNGQFCLKEITDKQGGKVTIKTSAGAALATGQTASIERVVPLTQEYDLKEGATIDPTALNTAFDRTVAQSQQIDDKISKAITFPATDESSVSYSVDESAASRSGKVLGFDATGSVTPLAVTALSTGTSTSIAGGNGITNNEGTISVNNDSDHLDFDGSGKLKIKTSGVTATELATNSVETAKIKDDAVTPAKISSVTGTDVNIVTGTAGTNGNLLKWDANGDAIDSGFNITDSDNLGTSDTTLATQGNVKAYVNSLIPRCIVLDGSGAVTVGGQTGVSGVDDISSGAISNNYLDYFIQTTGSGAIDMMYNASSAPSNGQILTVPLSGLTSTKKTFSSTNIIGMWVRPQLQVDAHDETGIIDADNPQVKIEYYMPRGQDDVSDIDDTNNYRYDAIGWRRESEGGQLSNINSMVYIPVNARSGGQPSVRFRFGMKVKSGSLTMRAGLTLHAVNVVGLTT